MRKKSTTLIQGMPSDRVVLSSDYVSTQAMAEDISQMDDWYDLLETGIATGTIAANSNTVSVVNGSLSSDGTLRAGDIFSPDDGLNWYNILSVPDNNSFVLRSDVVLAPLSASSFLIARPKYRRVYLDNPNNLNTLNFKLTANPIFIHVINTSGSPFVMDSGNDGSFFTPQRQGVTILYGMKTRQESYTEGHIYWGGGSGVGEGFIDMSNHCEEYNGRHDLKSVDVIRPFGGFGSVKLVNSYYESAQDMMLIETTGRFEMEDCTCLGRVTDLGFGFGIGIRMFLRSPDLAENCKFIIDSRDAPLSKSNVFGATDQVGGNVSIINNSEIYFIGSVDTEFNVIGNSGLTVADCDITMNNCIIDASGSAVGTPDIVRATTYTGAGSLTMNQCTKTNVVDGGGGVFSITNT